MDALAQAPDTIRREPTWSGFADAPVAWGDAMVGIVPNLIVEDRGSRAV
jgi:hypothetical protein